MEHDSSVRETYRNVLIYARTIVGDERLLAERLGVKPQQIHNWTNGIEPVPAQIFLKIVDVVVTATSRRNPAIEAGPYERQLVPGE